MAGSLSQDKPKGLSPRDGLSPQAEEPFLQPWQFFLLGGMLAATATVIVATGQSPANIIILSLTVVSVSFVGLGAYRMLSPLVAPAMLLLVGGASAKAMLRKDEGILSLRGRWHEWRPEGGGAELPAMPTLHPAFLLRQPGAKKRAWADLLTLTERLDRPARPD